jgi:prophage tail gpP-like protein
VFNRVPEKVILRVAGVDWAGWTSAEVTWQIDAISSEFALGLTDRWIHGEKARPLAAGMPCELLTGENRLVNGYLDKVDFSIGPAAHSVSASGRDKSADLVDCSAIHKPGFWQDINLLELGKALAEPFGVEISTEVDLGESFSRFKLEEGETAFEAFDRALRQREILALSDGRGGIKLAKLAQKVSSTALVQGENIKDSSASYDMADRFSDYIVKGQRPGSDEDYGVSCAAVRGEARDESVVRYRPLLVRAEEQVGDGDAIKRAKWEASTRAARSVTVAVTLEGWRQYDGSLWEVNTIVYCDIPYLRIDQELLISKVTFSLSRDSGTITKLELKDPKAFEPEPPKKSSAAGGGGRREATQESQGGDLQQESAENAWSAHKEITSSKEGA